MSSIQARHELLGEVDQRVTVHHSSVWRSRMTGLDRLLGLVTEIPAAVLVLAEIAVLLAGVVARYVFNQPLVWSDELASILFLWLTMFGSVIALRRGEHMRLTTFIEKMSGPRRAWLEAFGTMIVIVFLLCLLGPAYEHLHEQWAITTPALEIPDGMRVASIAVGAFLMLVIAVSRFLQVATWSQAIGALGAVALIACAGWLLSPVLMTLGNVNLILFFVLILGVCVTIGVPIAFAFGVATMGYLSFSTTLPLSIVPGRMDEGMSHLILLSVPLFVTLGALTEMTGIARAMIDFLVALIGHVRGGLQYVLLAAMYLVSGISGSKVADMAAVAPALLPAMKKRGAHEGDTIALLSASCAMSETIPPSLVLITIGSVTGVSIAALFTGGLLPAVVGFCALSVVVYWKNRHENMTGIVRTGRAQILKTFFVAIPALILPFVIRAAVVEGVATATEVSTVGIVYAVIVGLLIYRRFDWRRVYPMLVDTASLSGAIILIIGCATAMSWSLTQSGFSRQLVTGMTSVPGGQLGFLAVSLVVFVLLGSILEGIPAIVLFGPLLFPVAQAIGVHPVHYAMVVVFAMGLGLFAPPLGVGFYAACAIGRSSPDQAIKCIWPYLGALFIALLIIAAVPWISTGFL